MSEGTEITEFTTEARSERRRAEAVTLRRPAAGVQRGATVLRASPLARLRASVVNSLISVPSEFLLDAQREHRIGLRRSMRRQQAGGERDGSLQRGAGNVR